MRSAAEEGSLGTVNHTGPLEESAEAALTSVDPSCLLPSRCRAYDIITWYLAATLSGQNPPQLLMQIQGEGGTGKSKVIQTVTEYFATQESCVMLLKAAYTGIAASIINGKTTHTIGKISLTDGKEMSQEAKE
ncbi:hypothetical protein K439DRAFT_1373600 [Ramaria rubella]|nr:hypothetical protein K439DRAFT_1373600 [Ramaria rubella]